MTEDKFPFETITKITIDQVVKGKGLGKTIQVKVILQGALLMTITKQTKNGNKSFGQNHTVWRIKWSSSPAQE